MVFVPVKQEGSDTAPTALSAKEGWLGAGVGGCTCGPATFRALCVYVYVLRSEVPREVSPRCLQPHTDILPPGLGLFRAPCATATIIIGCDALALAAYERGNVVIHRGIYQLQGDATDSDLPGSAQRQARGLCLERFSGICGLPQRQARADLCSGEPKFDLKRRRTHPGRRPSARAAACPPRPRHSQSHKKTHPLPRRGRGCGGLMQEEGLRRRHAPRAKANQEKVK